MNIQNFPLPFLRPPNITKSLLPFPPQKPDGQRNHPQPARHAPLHPLPVVGGGRVPAAGALQGHGRIGQYYIRYWGRRLQVRGGLY